jgi:hypothetical protein
MSDKEDGGQAFPLGASEYAGHGPQAGMTLRDFFAANAVLDLEEYTVMYATGILGRGMPDYAAYPLENAAFWAEFRAKMRFIEADAMIEVRNQ